MSLLLLLDSPSDTPEPDTPVIVSDRPYYQVWSQDREGNIIAAGGSATRVLDYEPSALNDDTTATVRIPYDDALFGSWNTVASGEPQTGLPEIAIARDGLVVWRGAPEEWDLDDETRTATAHCDSLSIKGIVIGDGHPHNSCPDGDMESPSTAAWTAWPPDTDVDTPADLAKVSDSVRGARALQITCPEGGAGGAEISANFTGPKEIQAAVWIKIPVDSEPPYGVRTWKTIDGKEVDVTWAQEPDGYHTVRGEWMRMQIDTIKFAAGESGTLTTRLYGNPNGAILFDELWWYVPEWIGVGPGGTSTTLVANVMEYACLKADLNCYVSAFTSAFAPVTGFPDGMKLYTSETPDCAGVVSQWGKENQWRFVPSTRVFQVGHRLGQDFDAYTVLPGRITKQVTISGREKVNSVVANGSGSAPRPQWGQVSGTVGVTERLQEMVANGDEGMTLKLLDGLGTKIIHFQDRQTIAVTVPADTPLGGRCSGDWLTEGLAAGDRLRMRRVAGPYDFVTVQTVTRMKVYPMDSDRLELDITLDIENA